MNITLEIKPEVQAELERQAAATGLAVERHAATILEEAVHVPATELSRSGLGRRLVEVCAMAKGLTDDLDLSRGGSTWRPLDLS